MIYLTTGANGACKTLMTIWDVRQQQLKENRPVYYHGFEMVQKYADEFGWKPFDPKKWQDLPDGSICIMDECQNEFPVRPSKIVPDYVNAVAQFRRKRGFDFWMITPHPKLIDPFIRDLIGSPSWHRHFKRVFGLERSNELMFNAVDLKCEARNSGTRAEVKMRTFPKEAYAWYVSASKHTAKVRIPKQIYILLALLLIIPLMIWGAFSMVGSKVEAAETKQQEVGQNFTQGPAKVLTVAEYVKTYKPRLEGFPHSAPRYDEITKPVVAPYPAACLVMADECRCYSQQSTRLAVSDDICRDIALKGFFVDWQQPEPKQAVQPSVSRAEPKERVSRTVPVPGAGAVFDAQAFAEYEQRRKTDEAMTALAIRNAGPRIQRSLSNF